MRIINLTQHPASPEQIAAGVEDIPAGPLRDKLLKLLTFDGDEPPTYELIEERVREISDIVWIDLSEEDDDQYENGEGTPYEAAMIGGAPFLMGPLDNNLDALGVTPLYAYSKRVSVEQRQPDGSTKKVSEFKHIGFVGGDQRR